MIIPVPLCPGYEGDVRVSFDDSIITDTAAEKQQDMAEVAAGLMEPAEYRAKWYGHTTSPCQRTAGEAREIRSLQLGSGSLTLTNPVS